MTTAQKAFLLLGTLILIALLVMIGVLIARPPVVIAPTATPVPLSAADLTATTSRAVDLTELPLVYATMTAMAGE